MKRALNKLKRKPSIAYIDGLFAPKIKKIKCKTVSIVGRKNGYAGKKCDISVIIPNIQKNLMTPFAESSQVLIWHLLVSHPELKKRKTKW